MNVASLQNSKELHELSGWETGEWQAEYAKPWATIPQYGLDFLIRKLPKWLPNGAWLQIEWSYIGSRDFCMGYMGTDDWFILETSKQWHGLPDNEKYPRGIPHHDMSLPDIYRHGGKYIPIEDMAAKLAIELFKQNILTKEDQ